VPSASTFLDGLQSGPRMHPAGLQVCARCQCAFGTSVPSFTLVGEGGLLEVCELCSLLAHAQLLISSSRLSARERDIFAQELRSVVTVLHELAVNHASARESRGEGSGEGGREGCPEGSSEGQGEGTTAWRPRRRPRQRSWTRG
jgi:hypothetical protein